MALPETSDSESNCLSREFAQIVAVLADPQLTPLEELRLIGAVTLFDAIFQKLSPTELQQAVAAAKFPSQGDGCLLNANNELADIICSCTWEDGDDPNCLWHSEADKKAVGK